MDDDWVGRVRRAQEAEDHPMLAQLFAEALAAEGRALATRSWLDAISGYDADAVTG